MGFDVGQGTWGMDTDNDKDEATTSGCSHCAGAVQFSACEIPHMHSMHVQVGSIRVSKIPAHGTCIPCVPCIYTHSL